MLSTITYVVPPEDTDLRRPPSSRCSLKPHTVAVSVTCYFLCKKRTNRAVKKKFLKPLRALKEILSSFSVPQNPNVSCWHTATGRATPSNLSVCWVKRVCHLIHLLWKESSYPILSATEDDAALASHYLLCLASIYVLTHSNIYWINIEPHFEFC